MEILRLSHRRLLAALGFALASLAITGAAQAAAQRYHRAVLANSPVRYWRRGEPSGMTAADSAPYHYDAQYVGTSPRGAGALYTDSNGSAYLDGSSKIVSSQDCSWLG